MTFYMPLNKSQLHDKGNKNKLNGRVRKSCTFYIDGQNFRKQAAAVLSMLSPDFLLLNSMSNKRIIFNMSILISVKAQTYK